MQGPLPNGSFRGMTQPPHWEEGRLLRGKKYRVIKEFVDFEGDIHPVGEEWVFVASMFSHYDELLLIGIRDSSGVEWKFHLEASPSDQHQVMRSFLEYVTLV